MKLSKAPQLGDNLNLKFSLEEGNGPVIHIVTIPSSILRPKENFTISISKINSVQFIGTAPFFKLY